jgi:galactofuranose transport system substrate-binding protein
MKKLFYLGLAAILSVTVVGCGKEGNQAASTSKSADSGAKRELVVGFSQMEMNNPWRIAETKSIKDEAKKRGIKLIYSDAQSSTSKQVSDVEDMIAQKVNYIILAPREFEGLAPALEEAKKANIPVILVDRKAKGEAGKDYLTFIGSDFVKEGLRDADWLAKAMNGKGNIVELTGTAGSSVAIDRHNGFANELKAKAPDMKIIASQTGDFARANGQKTMENLLQSLGNKINAVYAHNDEMAIGAINAIKAAGKVPGKDITIVSADGEKDGLKAIVAGEIGAIVECSPYFGPPAFDAIQKHEKGEQVPTEIINQDRFFDKTNAAQLVDTAF